jgi:hypothetical protein
MSRAMITTSTKDNKDSYRHKTTVVARNKQDRKRQDMQHICKNSIHK